MTSEQPESSHASSVHSEPTETTSLLQSSTQTLSAAAPDVEAATYNKQSDNEDPTVLQDPTTWQQETAILAQTTTPLVWAFGAEYTFGAASIFAVGHLGTAELGGAALGMMSTNITGFLVFAGMATSLDTLCAQAYGSGKKELVGVYVQRMLFIFSIVYIPMIFLWAFSEPILSAIVPDQEVARFASMYLKVMIFAAPGFAIFECLKRFMQAQGIFAAGTWTMMVAAPLNIFLHWLLIYRLSWGFVGAPIAVAISQTILPFGMIAYAYFMSGSECWARINKSVLSNWRPMFELAIPGLIMLEAEACSFEFLVFASSQIGTTALAAQSILQTTIACTFMLFPYPSSVAGSTRIGNLIGGARVESARTATRVLIASNTFLGLVCMVLISVLRFKIPYLFNGDPKVVELTGQALPLCAAFQLFDSVQAGTNGVLRGLGRQKIGGYVLLFCLYVVGMPTSLGLAFGAKLDLIGLWTGTAVGLGLVCLVELIYLRYIDWQRVLDSALKRIALG